ncbi:hypothetical protein OIE61_30335 [Streptomyces sp. NBC_01762]|uniref:hypothetical protein n=1 Tax=unclassified Streptomyces TaxID=2593676 RepID=UPI002DDAC358|nr:MULTISPECIES: hypothetical protein [unclassified Streptomyces]WSC47920.1 hypothetical protein OIE61_30335 [Streptomyces sp. NBC_01762]WSD27571.1 hypothetical protein OHA26_31050 [Streptomyces sp. NBC_01751]
MELVHETAWTQAGERRRPRLLRYRDHTSRHKIITPVTAGHGCGNRRTDDLKTKIVCLNARMDWLKFLIAGAWLGGTLAVRLFQWRQRQLARSLVDGRQIKIVCYVKSSQMTRWTNGHFVINSGSWAWEPRRGETRALAADLQAAGVREPSTGDGRQVSYPVRCMVIECTSSEGDVLIAAPPGQFEYVFMALNRS